MTVQALAADLLATAVAWFTPAVPHSFVTAGAPAAPLGSGPDCELLTVHAARVYATNPATSTQASPRKGAVRPGVMFAITLFRCVPSGAKVTDATLGVSGAAFTADIDTLWTGICAGAANGDLFPTTLECPQIRPVDAIVGGPSGAFVTVVATLEVAIG